MAPLPKRRHSSARQSKRARALSVPSVSLIRCANCGRLKLTHRVCEYCGFYDGRQVLTIKPDTKGKDKTKQ